MLKFEPQDTSIPETLLMVTRRLLNRKRNPVDESVRRDLEHILRFCIEAGYESSVLRK